ncbi:hypothetical protein CDL15_Pgr016296 [Punica granatum]|nr:hypothetical protein CDL15_Pgr016296 [Punica granatum]
MPPSRSLILLRRPLADLLPSPRAPGLPLLPWLPPDAAVLFPYPPPPPGAPAVAAPYSVGGHMRLGELSVGSNKFQFG